MSMTALPATPSEGAISAGALFRLHAPFVARFLFRLGVRPDAIDDAVQEVFLVVHRQGGYRPGPARPTSYLANLSLRAASVHRRSERRRRDRESDAPVEDVAAVAGGPVELLETNESLRRLDTLLERLEPDLRTTLILAEIEGETCASIAAAMGIPVGTVYWRLHQARKKFQKALQAHDATTRPRRELAVHTAGAGYPRALQKERAGMLVLLMPSSRWATSEARDLLRLASERHPVGYAVEEGLARHMQIAASSVPTPSWAAGSGAGWIAAAPFAAIPILGVIAVIAFASHRTAPAPAPALARQPIVAGALPVEHDSAWIPARTAAGAMSPGGSDALPVEQLPRATTPSSVLARTNALPATTPAALKETQTAATDAVPVPAGPVSRETQTAATDVAPAPAGPDELSELRDVAEAERALATNPARALAIVHADQARLPHGYLEEERRYVAIMALFKLGRVTQARPEADAFLRDYPDGAFGRRIREASRAALDP